MVRCLNILVLLVAGAVAFTAPQTKSSTKMRPTKKAVFPQFDQNKAAIQVAALASVSAAMPANAFAAEYLPAILVPVMTLFLPVIGMTMSWILVDKNEI